MNESTVSTSRKHHGTFDELIEKVEAAGGIIVSTEIGDNKHVIRTLDGVVLNWWESTGTVNPQGNPKLWRILMERMNGEI